MCGYAIYIKMLYSFFSINVWNVKNNSPLWILDMREKWHMIVGDEHVLGVGTEMKIPSINLQHSV